MLTQHTVHNTSVSCQTIIIFQKSCIPVTILLLKYFIQTVGHRLIRSEDTEVLVFFIQFEDITDVSAQLDHILCFRFTRLHFDSICTEIRQTQVF